MKLRLLVIAGLVAVALLGYLAWHSNQTPPQTAAPPAGEMPGGDAGGDVGGMPPGMMGGGEPADAGVSWEKPARWEVEAGSSMRLATFKVPSTVNGVEAAECALYYFGPGQGGGVDANLVRWAGEFEGSPTPERKDFQADGMKVNRVRLRGTYRAHAGMGGQGPSGPMPDYTLLGAIVEGPNGPVFVKLIGPSRTVDPAEKEFDAMLRGFKKSGGA
jgi:hypothetical protein